MVPTGTKKDIQTMKFNAIVGNPPYQLTDGSGAAGDAAMPIYNRFVDIAKEIKPNYISMIMPSKWMIGGRGLQQFRKNMTEDKHIEKMVDYENDREIFPTIHIDGGLCYMLWNKNYSGKVKYAYKPTNGGQLIYERDLKNDTSSFIVRDFRRQEIIKKVTAQSAFSKIVSARKPFGINTDLFNAKEKYPEYSLSDKEFAGSCLCWGVTGIKGGAKRVKAYIKRSAIPKNQEWVDKYKLGIAKSYSTRAINFPELLVAGPNVVFSETFLVIGPFDTKEEQLNCLKYTETRFFKLLLFFGKGTMQVTQEVFAYVPLQDFTAQSDINWSKSVAEINQQLYKKYNLSHEEIDFIEKKIKPM